MKPNHFILRNRAVRSDMDEFGFSIESFPECTSITGTLHTHDLIEMVYVVKGEGFHLLNKGKHPAVPGSLAVIHHNQTHGFETPNGGLSLINIYIDMNRFELPLMPKQLRHVLPQILPLHPRFRHNLRDLVYLQLPDPSRITGMLTAMQDELTHRPPGFSNVLHHWFSLFLTEACRCYLEQQTDEAEVFVPGEKVANSTQRIVQLCRYLDSHFTEQIHLDDLAKLSGLQKNYLCRVFKAQTGQTILNYIIHQRLGQAMLLLRQTPRPIVEIALESGFNDLPHFNRTFHREVGKSPREYRREWV